MTTTNPHVNDTMCPAIYQIRVKGHLNHGWEAWFDGFNIRLTEHGETVLCGQIVDQASLHSLLRRVRDLGLTLLSVNQVEVESPTNGNSGG